MNRFRTSEMGSTLGRGGVFRMLSIVDMIVSVYVFTISERRAFPENVADCKILVLTYRLLHMMSPIPTNALDSSKVEAVMR